MRPSPSGRLAQDRAEAGDGPAEGVLGRGADRLTVIAGLAVVVVLDDRAPGGPGPVHRGRPPISVSTRAWVPGSYQP